MKKSIIYLIFLILCVNFAFATVNVTITAPGAVYFSTSLPMINATTDVNSNCTYSIDSTLNGTLNGQGSLAHNISDVDISSLSDGNVSLLVFCFDITNVSNNGTDILGFVKDTSNPDVTWLTPTDGDNVTAGATIVLNVTGHHTTAGVNATFSVSCNGSSNGTLLGDWANSSIGQNIYSNFSQSWTAPSDSGVIRCDITANVTSMADEDYYNESTIYVMIYNNQQVVIISFTLKLAIFSNVIRRIYKLSHQLIKSFLS